MLYTCGVISYYDDDVIQARAFLDRAVQHRATDHEAEAGANESYRKRFASMHYFRAIIQKNWGELPEALHEIELSAKLLKDDATEFLTPTTKAELLSYEAGNEKRCRSELEVLLKRLKDVEEGRTKQGKQLNPNQRRLRNRMLVLLGNTYFVVDDLRSALEQYDKALQFTPDDYYALASAAQCHQALDTGMADDFFTRCLTAIERSGDFNRKTERITRAVIAVLAANAAKGCSNPERYDHWAREARELLEGDLAVDGLSPKFFSPSTKRLVSSADLLQELEQPFITGASA